MKKLTVLFLCILVGASISTPQKKHFERIEKLPEGDQIRHAIGSFFGGIKDWNVEEYIFDAPYETVWPAVKRVSEKFAKVGGRPIVGIEEPNGRIQNGRISQDALIGMGPGAWLDLFVLEATRVSDTSTKVSVARKVVEKEMTGDRPIKAQWSSGKIERYLLTQIEDELRNPTSARRAANIEFPSKCEPRDYSKSAPGKYANKNDERELLELKPDGSFFLQQSGKGFAGKYEIAGDVLTIILANGTAARVQMCGNMLLDNDGPRLWVKSDAPAKISAVTVQTSELLTNADVLRMKEAKLPDSVIIAKIKGSTCNFDTSTDALIKLKQAAVSDAVIQAMIESAPK